MASSDPPSRHRRRGFARFFAEYTSGMEGRALHRLIRKDATDAMEILTRDLPPEKKAHSSDPVARFLVGTRRLLMGLSLKLSPMRRLLFGLAVVSAVLSIPVDEFRVYILPFLPLELGPALAMLAVVLLIFVLALEMMDRLKVRDELEVARQLQRDLLPEGEPKVPGCTVRHSYRTANEVGGDYYNFLPLPDGRVAVVIGDASGHGMAAGLLMAIAEATLQLGLDLDPSPPRVAELLNRSLCRTGSRRAYMSLFLGILDPESGEMEYICAGHPFPILRRKDGSLEELGEGGFPLGLSPRTAPANCRTRLDPGDLLVLYTDGLPEAIGKKGSSFGFPRLRALVAPGGAPEEVLQRILTAFDGFLDGEAPMDDVSVAVLVRQGSTPPKPPPPPPAELPPLP